MRLLVSGGRWYGTVHPDATPETMTEARRLARDQRHVIFDALADFAERLEAEQRRKLVLIHGACRTGLDRNAADAADTLLIGCEPYEAEWRAFGRSAGPRRNQRMIDEGKPDYALIFPGGDGTKDMLLRIIKAGIPYSRVGD